MLGCRELGTLPVRVIAGLVQADARCPYVISVYVCNA
jgi:hypothetical protein